MGVGDRRFLLIHLVEIDTGGEVAVKNRLPRIFEHCFYRRRAEGDRRKAGDSLPGPDPGFYSGWVGEAETRGLDSTLSYCSIRVDLIFTSNLPAK